MYSGESRGITMISNYENDTMNESMVEAYIIETRQQIENIEEALLQSEKLQYFEPQRIDEIFRCMHSIKGASAMMMYDNIANVAHKVEDLLYFIRENPEAEFDVARLIDVIFEGVDFLSSELDKVRTRSQISDIPQNLIQHIVDFLEELKNGEKKVEEKKVSSVNNCYHVKMKFLPDCEMENLRAFAMVHALGDISIRMIHFPKELASNPEATEQIRNSGFEIFIETSSEWEGIENVLSGSVFLDKFEFQKLDIFPDENNIESYKNVEIKENLNIENQNLEDQNSEIIIEFLKDLFLSKNKDLDVEIAINLNETFGIASDGIFDIAKNYGFIDETFKRKTNSEIVLCCINDSNLNQKISLKLNLRQDNNVLKNNFEDILKTRAFIKNKENIDLLKLIDLARKSDIEASRELIVVVSRYKNNIPEISKQVKFLLENQELFNEVRKTLENREEGSL